MEKVKKVIKKTKTVKKKRKSIKKKKTAIVINPEIMPKDGPQWKFLNDLDIEYYLEHGVDLKALKVLHDKLEAGEGVISFIELGIYRALRSDKVLIAMLKKMVPDKKDVSLDARLEGNFSLTNLHQKLLE